MTSDRSTTPQRRLYSGTAHEFFGMGAAVKTAADAQKYGGQALRASFGAPAPQ